MRDVDHVNLAVDDLSTSHRFYEDVLDLSLRRGPEEFDGDHAMFDVGDRVLTLMATGRGANGVSGPAYGEAVTSGNREQAGADHWDERGIDHPLDKAHLAFAADRPEYERLVDELDGQFPKQGPYDWGTFEGFYFLDPSGNLLEVVTRDPPSDPERVLLDHEEVE